MSSQVDPTFRQQQQFRWYLFGIISIHYKRHGPLTKVNTSQYMVIQVSLCLIIGIKEPFLIKTGTMGAKINCQVVLTSSAAVGTVWLVYVKAPTPPTTPDNGMACWTLQGQYWSTGLLTGRELPEQCWNLANCLFFLWICSSSKDF